MLSYLKVYESRIEPYFICHPYLEVSIWSSDSDGNPDSNLGTLTHAASQLETGLNLFRAAATGIALHPGTTYFVVQEVTSEKNRSPKNGVTNSNDEDENRAPGWSIADTAHTKVRLGGTWKRGTGLSSQFAVYGYAKNTTQPSVSSVELVSTPVHDTNSDNTPDTYGLGEKIRVRLTFNEAVNVYTVGGTPGLNIQLVQQKFAAYESGSGTNRLTFAYEVVAGNLSAGGTGVVQNSLQRNGGRIKSVATHRDTTLTHAGLGLDANHKVDGSIVESAPPAFQSAAVNGAALSVTFDEDLDTGSALAGSAFTASGGRTGTGTTAISGATATVEVVASLLSGRALARASVGGGFPSLPFRLQGGVTVPP